MFDHDREAHEHTHRALARIESDQRVLALALGQIFNNLYALERNLMNSLDSLRAQVAATTTVMSSALALISGLQSQLASAIQAAKDGDDHAALDKLAADLSTGSSALALAVQANTAPDTASTSGAAAPADTVTGGAVTGSGDGSSGSAGTTAADTVTGEAAADPGAQDSVAGGTSTTGG